MEPIKELIRRMAYLLTSNRRRRELEDEMAFHGEMAAHAGRPEIKFFGNPTRLHEQSREAWGWTWIDRLFQDLRYATRMLLRSPGFTITAILILAIGIGVNVSAFSLFNLAVLKPLPLRDPDSLLLLEPRSPSIIQRDLPYPTVLFFREHARTLSAFIVSAGARMEVDDDAQPARVNFVSANFFSELGATAAYGRLFNPAQDEVPDTPPVAVIGHEYWVSHFGSDPGLIGKVIRLNHKPVTVIGIEPYGFPDLEGSRGDVWLPVTSHPYFIDGSRMLTDTANGSVRVWGRLAPGKTSKMAQDELLQLVNQLRKIHPKEIWKDEFIHTDPGGHQALFSPEMYLAAAVVGVLTLLILAVACANLGGLLLARGASREHEFSIRIAIGASRKRIFRQLFTESLLLALLGSAAGLALSYLALRIILATTDAPAWMSAAPDWRVIVFVVTMAILTSILFGFAPALQLSRQGKRKTLARQILIAAQVAASCVLIIVASLLVRAVQHTLFTNPGFGYEQVISISPGLNDHSYKPEAAKAYLEQLRDRVHALPGVISVSLVKLPPLGHGVTRIDTEINGHPLAVFPNWVEPEYFRTMEIPILLGRNFTPGEKHVVLVSQSLAQRRWPGQDPVGQQYGDDDSAKDLVIGVVGNARVNDLNEGDSVELYSTAQLEDMPGMSLILKTRGAPDGLTPTLKTIVQTHDPKLFPEISLLKANFNKQMKSIELAALAVSFIGVLAMVLAGVGLLGLIAFTIAQRTREIAIRLALGAPRLKVLRSVLGQFSIPVLSGLVLGITGTAVLSQILRRVLYGVSNLDPISYVAAIAILIATIACAALLPTRRALNLDVAKALHQD